MKVQRDILTGICVKNKLKSISEKDQCVSRQILLYCTGNESYVPLALTHQ